MSVENIELSSQKTGATDTTSGSVLTLLDEHFDKELKRIFVIITMGNLELAVSVPAAMLRQMPDTENFGVIFSNYAERGTRVVSGDSALRMVHGSRQDRREFAEHVRSGLKRDGFDSRIATGSHVEFFEHECVCESCRTPRHKPRKESGVVELGGSVPLVGIHPNPGPPFPAHLNPEWIQNADFVRNWHNFPPATQIIESTQAEQLFGTFGSAISHPLTTGLAAAGIGALGRHMVENIPEMSFVPLARSRDAPRPRSHVPAAPLVGIHPNPGPNQKKKIGKRGKSVPRMKTTGGRNQPQQGAMLPVGLPIVSTRVMLPGSVRKPMKVQVPSIYTGPGFSGVVTPGTILYSLLIDRATFRDTPFNTLFRLFERIIGHSITVEVVPTLNTNQSGTISGCLDADPNDQQTVGVNKPVGFVTGHKYNHINSVFGAPWRVTMPLNTGKMYTDCTFYESTGGTVSDARLNTFAAFTVAAQSALSTLSTAIGDVYVTLDATFCDSGYTEDDGVLCMFKACGTGGSSLFTLGGSNILATLFTTLQNTQGNSLLEYAWQPSFFDGTNFHIPPGDWRFKWAMGALSTMGTVGAALNTQTGAVYSTDVQAFSFNSSDTLEFTSDFNGAAPSQIVVLTGAFHVSKGSTGSNDLLFSPTITAGTSGQGVVWMEVILQKLPSNMGNRLASQFPIGNNTTTVQMGAGDSKDSFCLRTRVEEKHHVQTLTHDEYKDFLAWKNDLASHELVIDDTKVALQPVPSGFLSRFTSSSTSSSSSSSALQSAAQRR